jgi:hypothetical protein
MRCELEGNVQNFSTIPIETRSRICINLKISALPSCDGIQKKLRFDHKITAASAGDQWRRVTSIAALQRVACGVHES